MRRRGGGQITRRFRALELSAEPSRCWPQWRWSTSWMEVVGGLANPLEMGTEATYGREEWLAQSGRRGGGGDVPAFSLDR